MMKRLVIALMLVGTSLQARLGETLPQCETRYGPVVEKKAAELPDSDKDACIFSKEGVTITAEFRGGAAWKMIYRMPTSALETILTAIEPEGGWAKPVMIAGQEVRIDTVSRDQIAVVTYPTRTRSDDPVTLVVCNRAFGKAQRTDYEKKLAGVEDILKQRAANRPLKSF